MEYSYKNHHVYSHFTIIIIRTIMYTATLPSSFFLVTGQISPVLIISPNGANVSRNVTNSLVILYFFNVSRNIYINLQMVQPCPVIII